MQYSLSRNVFEKTGKTTAIRRIDIQETSIFQHNEGSIKYPYLTHQYDSDVMIGGVLRNPQLIDTHDADSHQSLGQVYV